MGSYGRCNDFFKQGVPVGSRRFRSIFDENTNNYCFIWVQSKSTRTNGNPLCKKSHRIGHRNPYEAIVISFFVKYVLIEIYGNPCKPLSKNIIVSSIGTHTMQQFLVCLSNILIEPTGTPYVKKSLYWRQEPFMKQQLLVCSSNISIKIYSNPWEPSM